MSPLNNPKLFKHETLVITKNAWIALRNYDRLRAGYKTLPREVYEDSFAKHTMRNLGANGATYPIADDEIRIDRDSFNITWDEVKFFLDTLVYVAEGKPVYRYDGFVQEGINI